MPKAKDISVGNDSKGIPEIIKDQLVLISFLIFFVGIVSTHTYYAVFGIKYQFLDLPTFSIVYHGLIILVQAPYLLIPYVLPIIWMILNDYSSLSFFSVRKHRILFTYLLIIAVLCITYPLAQIAGRKQAEADMSEESSTLPKIVYMELANGENFDLGNRYRLLIVDSKYVIYFKPRDNDEEDYLPNIKRIAKEKVNAFSTIR